MNEITFTARFPKPADLTEGAERLKRLGGQIAEIEADLSNRQAARPVGWRARTCRALKLKKKQRALLKRWLYEDGHPLEKLAQMIFRAAQEQLLVSGEGGGKIKTVMVGRDHIGFLLDAAGESGREGTMIRTVTYDTLRQLAATATR